MRKSIVILAALLAPLGFMIGSGPAPSFASTSTDLTTTSTDISAAKKRHKKVVIVKKSKKVVIVKRRRPAVIVHETVGPRVYHHRRYVRTRSDGLRFGVTVRGGSSGSPSGSATTQ